ncbi:AFG1 family ATPase [Acuticoccus sp. M5D2P5]|uniref:cell division protein ZapE n=1 Tax=Acuticoccus kalidii TaxID=2910977 RepID=UPI001EED6CC2|nr:cell division protein ZapE [Acuticoccus kalidii]MCF3935974.1 AFG1 family ATPase [Acuticoccus kalidii]
MADARPTTVIARYESLVRHDEMKRDAAQVAIAHRLDSVVDDLREEAAGRLTRFLRRRKAKAVRGLYVWGSVGRGKTMLMDLFYQAVPIEAKRRVHFNDFMADAHNRIARLRSETSDDAVLACAEEIADEARVLCFDEFAVTDIADAMILSRLFARIFEKGVTLVATSNVAPNDLYDGGLNRQLFVPFIRLLDQHVEVVRLDTPRDYRLDRLEDHRVWFQPGDVGFERLWRALLGDREAKPTEVPVKSRKVHVRRAAGGVARFSFAELCEAPLAAVDFLALAKRFHTIFLEGCPVMTPAQRETVRRFIVLIDVLYDQKVRLVVTAAAEPDGLFQPGEGGAREEAFAFARTASRLYEMRSASYLHDAETTPLT